MSTSSASSSLRSASVVSDDTEDQKVYVAAFGSAKVAVLDGHSGEVIDRIGVGDVVRVSTVTGEFQERVNK